MTTLAGHRGVAEDDPRNAGPVAFFRPKAVTRESVRRLLSRSLRGASPADIEMRVDKITTRIAAGHVKPSPPLSQSLQGLMTRITVSALTRTSSSKCRGWTMRFQNAVGGLSGAIRDSSIRTRALSLVWASALSDLFYAFRPIFCQGLILLLCP